MFARGRHKHRRQPSRPAAGRLLGFSTSASGHAALGEPSQARQMRRRCAGFAPSAPRCASKAASDGYAKRTARRRVGSDRRISAFCLSHEAAGYEWEAVKEMARCCGHFSNARHYTQTTRFIQLGSNSSRRNIAAMPAAIVSSVSGVKVFRGIGNPKQSAFTQRCAVTSQAQVCNAAHGFRGMRQHGLKRL